MFFRNNNRGLKLARKPVHPSKENYGARPPAPLRAEHQLFAGRGGVANEKQPLRLLAQMAVNSMLREYLPVARVSGIARNRLGFASALASRGMALAR